MKLDELMAKEVGDYLRRLPITQAPNLRSVERILTQMALVPQNPTPYMKMLDGYRVILCGLLILKILHPEIYRKIENDTVDFEEIVAAFSIQKSKRETDQLAWYIHQSWALFFRGEEVDDHQQMAREFRINSAGEPKRLFYSFKKQYFDTVQLGIPALDG